LWRGRSGLGSMYPVWRHLVFLFGGIFWFGLDHLSVPACTLRWPPSGAAVKDGRQAVAPATAVATVQTDPTAAFECSSQPPRSECCNNHLNPRCEPRSE
jgi:hypothetical protein